MKKNILYFLLTLGFFSCGSSNRNEEDIPEDFNFQTIMTVENSSSYALAFFETDTLKVGDTYRAKVFLTNRHNVYDSDLTEPIIRYYHEEPVYLEDFEKGILVKPVNDTAYVKFTVPDFESTGKKAITRNFYASIAIPLQKGDTLFSFEFPYTVLKE